MLAFGNPWPILAIPACLVLLAAGSLRSVPPISRRRKATALAVRLGAAALAGLSLGHPAVLVSGHRPFLTIFALDLSESIPERGVERTVDPLRKLWDAELRRGNSCALVAFAGRAEVLVPPGRHPLPEDPRLTPRSALARLRSAAEQTGAGDPSRLAALQQWIDRLQTRATDLAGALRVARSLSSEGHVSRIVVITDGRDTVRSSPGIELSPSDLIVAPEEFRRRDLSIVAVEPPLVVREGEPFDVRVAVEATDSGEISLSLLIDDEAVPESRRTFRVPSPGRHYLLLPRLLPPSSAPAGLHTLQILLEAAGDEEPRNNIGRSAFSITGKPRVLLVEGTPSEGAPLVRLLRAQDLDLTVETAFRPSILEESLEEFVAVILVGVPREAIPPDWIRRLRPYVESHGGGLWVVGSSALKGDRGYSGSDLEKLLPVTFLREDSPGGADSPPSGPRSAPAVAPEPSAHKVLAPSLALLFIIDKSGSMAGNNIAIVKEACIASARMLSPQDVVGVLAFDARPKWILEFTEADRQEYVTDRVLRLLADGGTNLQPALEEARRAFREDPRARKAGIKHAILLSDGDSLPGDFETSTRRLAAEGVTVTTVCVPGPRTDQHLMYQIASWGRGRFKFAPGFDSVPQIFTQEARQILGTVPRGVSPAAPLPPPPAPSGPPSSLASFPVRIRENHEVLQGLDPRTLPALKGLLRSAPRKGASVLLESSGDLPLLALGRLGLGKVAVWTSDVSGRWSDEWMAWPAAGKLFAQLVRHLSSAVSDTDLASRTSLSLAGDRAIVRVHPGPGDESLLATVPPVGPRIPFTREPDGSRRFEIPLGRPGDLRRLLLQRPDGKSLWIGAVSSYEEEFAPPGTGAGRTLVPIPWTELERRLEDGKIPDRRRLDLWPWLLAAAALALCFDVGIRRYAL